MPTTTDPIDLSPTRMPRVLLVDDCKVTQRLIANILRKDGWSVAIAENGVQALELLKHEAIDVVLMDLFMPMMDGIATTRQIRQLTNDNAPSSNENCAIIGISGDEPQQHVQDWISAGADGFLLKPIAPAILKLALNQLLKETILRRSSRLSKHQRPIALANESVNQLERTTRPDPSRACQTTSESRAPDQSAAQSSDLLQLIRQIQSLTEAAKLDDVKPVVENLASIASEFLTTLHHLRVPTHDQSPSRR